MYDWPFIPFELRHIGKPLLIWPVRMELTVKEVFGYILRILRLPRAAVVVVLNGGFDTFGTADTENAFVVDMNVFVVPKIIIDAAVALVRTVHVDLLNLLRDPLIFHCPDTLLSAGPTVVSRS